MRCDGIGILKLVIGRDAIVICLIAFELEILGIHPQLPNLSLGDIRSKVYGNYTLLHLIKVDMITDPLGTIREIETISQLLIPVILSTDEFLSLHREKVFGT